LPSIHAFAIVPMLHSNPYRGASTHRLHTAAAQLRWLLLPPTGQHRARPESTLSCHTAVRQMPLQATTVDTWHMMPTHRRTSRKCPTYGRRPLPRGIRTGSKALAPTPLDSITASVLASHCRCQPLKLSPAAKALGPAAWTPDPAT